MSEISDAVYKILCNIFIRFWSNLYRQIVGISMVTNCTPRVADLFVFCYVRDFIFSHSDNNHSDVLDHLTLPQDI